MIPPLGVIPEVSLGIPPEVLVEFPTQAPLEVLPEVSLGRFLEFLRKFQQ